MYVVNVQIGARMTLINLSKEKKSDQGRDVLNLEIEATSKEGFFTANHRFLIYIMHSIKICYITVYRRSMRKAYIKIEKS